MAARDVLKKALAIKPKGCAFCFNEEAKKVTEGVLEARRAGKQTLKPMQLYTFLLQEYPDIQATFDSFRHHVDHLGGWPEVK